jgi:hypothetical protein
MTLNSNLILISLDDSTHLLLGQTLELARVGDDLDNLGLALILLLALKLFFAHSGNLLPINLDTFIAYLALLCRFGLEFLFRLLDQLVRLLDFTPFSKLRVER